MIDQSNVKVTKELQDRAFKKKHSYNSEQLRLCLENLYTALLHIQNIDFIALLEFPEEGAYCMDTIKNRNIFYEYMACIFTSLFIGDELVKIIDEINKRYPGMLQKLGAEKTISTYNAK